ncbi:MAG TPA: WYL domain-containing protein [Chloroflexota bacterium]
MSRTERLLELMLALQLRTTFTVQQMADEMGVSRRTMLRDLQALSAMGVPLAATPGPGGGYSLLTRRRLLPLSLTADEALGLILSYESLLQYIASPFEEQSLSAVTKLRNALPPDVVHELNEIHRHVVVTQPTPVYHAPHLAAFLAASLQAVHLNLVYDSRSGRSSRCVFPHGMYAWQGFWYGLVHDYRRGTSISLRLDRVRELERVESMKAPPPLNVREWLEHRYDAPYEAVDLRMRVTARGATRFELNTLFGEIGVGPTGWGLVEARIPVTEIEYYAAQLLPLGADIVVESPPELIAALKGIARSVLDLYPS